MRCDRTFGASRALHCILLALIDTHCHLDLPPFDADRADAIARALAAGVTGMLVPAVRPRTWAALIELVHSRAAQSALRVAIGVHPQVVPELAHDEPPSVDDIARAATNAGAICVAIGECGLDGATGQPELQEQLLRAHIRAARALALPLVVHVLRAHDVAPRILREEHAADVGGVMHSYSGGESLVSVYRDLGFAFSFAGPVTYANARKPIAAARAVPRELLLVETDAPDQAPGRHRGHRSEPAFLPAIVEALAAARGETVDEVAAYTSRNARRIFDWGSFPA